MVKWIAATAVLVVLTGCEQQYRYPCHDPANWNTERCQKPLCEINKDCPEYILKGTNGNSNGGGSSLNFGTGQSQQCSTTSFTKSDQKGVCR